MLWVTPNGHHNNLLISHGSLIDSEWDKKANELNQSA